MNLVILVKLALYYLFNFDISITNQVGQRQFCIKDTYSYCMPYFANQDLNNRNINIDEAIIAIHGILKDANGMCNKLNKKFSNSNIKNHILIICPQYITKSDIKNNKLTNKTLYWSFEGAWNQ